MSRSTTTPIMITTTATATAKATRSGAAALSRRAFLRRSSEVAFAAAVPSPSAGALLISAEAWALEVKGLKPETMKTLILMARDIYPHDRSPTASTRSR